MFNFFSCCRASVYVFCCSFSSDYKYSYININAKRCKQIELITIRKIYFLDSKILYLYSLLFIKKLDSNDMKNKIILLLRLY